MLIVAILLIGFFACGGNEWSKADQEDFMESCLGGPKTVKSCECNLELAQDKWEDLDDVPLRGLSEIIDECYEKHPLDR